MKYLQLSNRIVNEKCENLCYINSSLNLLNLTSVFPIFLTVEFRFHYIAPKFPSQCRFFSDEYHFRGKEEPSLGQGDLDLYLI